MQLVCDKKGSKLTLEVTMIDKNVLPRRRAVYELGGGDGVIMEDKNV